MFDRDFIAKTFQILHALVEETMINGQIVYSKKYLDFFPIFLTHPGEDVDHQIT